MYVLNFLVNVYSMALLLIKVICIQFVKHTVDFMCLVFGFTSPAQANVMLRLVS